MDHFTTFKDFYTGQEKRRTKDFIFGSCQYTTISE